MAATMTCAGAATSQTPPPPTTVNNTQVQLGDIFSQQTLNVVDQTGPTTLNTISTGNSVSGAVINSRLDLTSLQSMQGDTRATTTINGTGSIGDGVTVITESAANSGDASAQNADMNATVTQSVTGSNVLADTVIAAPAGSLTSGANVDSNAIGNTQSYGVDFGTATTSTTQTNGAVTQATMDATIQSMPATTTFTASAIGNNVSADGTNSTQVATVNQTMTGARTQASLFVGSGNAWDATGASTAVANNASVNNAGGSLDTSATQANTAYVRADATVASYEFGTLNAMAFGAGNSSQAGEQGPLLNFDNTQTTTGGVEVFSTVNGTTGFDANASAIAVGNTTTGYACGDCQASMSINNSQTNSDGVSATATVNIAGQARGMTGTATATGNSATFFVTKPTH
ncbi:MAG: holdfast anchor protein HfaD [Proteobacteria bacterium]|nr:holdfast anchor protein HfaD [Pseudomonadota bacterium]